jgi:hypothetical protein
MASHVPDRRALLSRVWTLFTTIALCTSAVPATAAGPTFFPAPVVMADPEIPGYEPTLDRSDGPPGQHVMVTFPDDETGVDIGDCKAGFDSALTPCVKTPTGHAVDLVVPSIPPQEVNVTWQVTPAGVYTVRALPEGVIPFRVLAPVFDVTLDKSEGFPGGPVVVTFASRTAGVSIKECRAWMEAGPGVCRLSDGVGTAEVTAPGTVGDARLLWTLTYAFDIESRGATKGSLPFRVIPRPSEPPPPPPVFHVVTDPDTAGPGEPVTVRFSSGSDGVTLDKCAAGFGAPIQCDDADSVVVLVPSDARVGTTIKLGWELTYASTRPGESGRTQSGHINFPVTVDKPTFAVTVEPGAAAPGQPVLVSIQSLVPGIDIVDCLVFFPNDAGSECQRSPDRWFARTRVPTDAAPGMTILRWGVGARTARGDPSAANGIIDYEVLARPGPSSSASSNSDTADPGASGTPPVPSVESGSVSKFVVATEPESTRPGGSVLVTVSPAEPGVEITACLVAFAGQRGSECRPSGDQWAATVTVPDDARPGDLPLRWGVASRTTATGRAGADNGLIDYRVLGDEPEPPAFSIRPDPAGAPPGQQVAVVQTSLIDDVAITDCSAGFDRNAMSPCRQSAQGWLADVVVPPTMHAGPSTVRWRLAYARDRGGSGTTDGLVTFTVLAAPGPPDGGGRWWAYLWRAALGAVVLAGLVGYRRVTRYFRERRRPVQQDDGDDVAPVRVRVSARQRLDRMAVAVSDPEARPVWQVRITTQEPDLDPVIIEEKP